MLYHVDFAGTASKCSAAIGNCNAAPAASHFMSLADAKADAEAASVVAPISAPSAPSGLPMSYSTVAKSGRGVNAPMELFRTSQSIGRMNPLNGDGDDRGNWDAGGVIVLAKSDGSRARVVAGIPDHYSDPELMLGKKAHHVKYSPSGTSSETPDLIVMGYVDDLGAQYGWIPDKRIHYFIFK